MLASLFAAILAVSAHAQGPKDFAVFWEQTKKELRAVPLDAKLEPDPAHSDDAAACFKASYAALAGAVVHARYCRPAREGKYPAILISPWYGQGAIPPPSELAKEGFAALWYQARGFEVDLSSYPIENSWYSISGIDSPRTYVYRGIVAAALRGLDFLSQRPEVDAKRLGALGSSQGGGLSLLAAGFDRRVKAAAADFPFLSDWPESMKEARPPYADVRDYIAKHPDQRAKVMTTVSYFDALNVADKIKIPILVNVGLKDRTCPPEGIKTVYARIKSKAKSLKEYPDADHGDRNAERWQAISAFLTARLSAL